MAQHSWIVRPCKRYAGGATEQVANWRVQRWKQLGHDEGAFEMAFVHSSNELCQAVAQLLNEWELRQGH